VHGPREPLHGDAPGFGWTKIWSMIIFKLPKLVSVEICGKNQRNANGGAVTVLQHRIVIQLYSINSSYTSSKNKKKQ